MTSNSNKMIDTIIHGDALDVLGKMDSNSIDIVLTDPPYFLDKMDKDWNHQIVSDKRNQQQVKSLPAGMKFSRQQGLDFYKWYLEVSKMIFKVLKPGGFFFSFSSPRLYHRMASAIDDAGFEMRDCFLWLYTQNQPKAMSLNHFLKKLNISNEAKNKLEKQLKGWKTPQIRSCFEPISMAQKPSDGTLLNNIIKYKMGLFNTLIKVGDNMFPSNILTIDHINEIMDKNFLIKKPTKEEKGSFNSHMTVKPLKLCEHLIKLSTFSEKAIVLDPFMGSGTTAVAAKNTGRHFIGIDTNQEYIDIAIKRLGNPHQNCQNEH